MIWLSPAYPVGGYSYSHGLEWIVEAGKVRDAATLGAWIEDVLAHGAGRSDAIFLAEAWRALAGGDMAALEQWPSWRRRSPLGRAAPGNDGAGHGLPRRHARRLAQAGIGGIGSRRARGCLSDCRRRCCRRARPAAGRDGTGVRAGLRRQPGLGRRAPHPARPERRPARAGAAGAADPARGRGGVGLHARRHRRRRHRRRHASMRHETQYTRLFRS